MALYQINLVPFDGSTPRGEIRVFFGCERDLDEKPSLRVYRDASLAEAANRFWKEHGLHRNAAARAAVMVEIA